jgi:hypothetical protein
MPHAYDCHRISHGLLRRCGQAFFISCVGIGDTVLDENAAFP